MKRSVVVLLLVSITACQRAAPTVSVATIEPLYKTSKAIEGATSVGVNNARFGELLQEFSTAIAIAKDHAATNEEKALLASYIEGLEFYKMSATLWQMKSRATEYIYVKEGEIPVWLPQTPNDQEGLKIAERLGLTPHESFSAKGSGATFKAVPEDAVQLAWAKAQEPIGKANRAFIKAQTDAPR